MYTYIVIRIRYMIMIISFKYIYMCELSCVQLVYLICVRLSCVYVYDGIQKTKCTENKMGTEVCEC
jgi:hypothetical protein